MEREVAEVEEAERKAATARQEEAAVLFGQLQQVRFVTSWCGSFLALPPFGRPTILELTCWVYGTNPSTLERKSLLEFVRPID